MKCDARRYGSEVQATPSDMVILRGISDIARAARFFGLRSHASGLGEKDGNDLEARSGNRRWTPVDRRRRARNHDTPAKANNHFTLYAAIILPDLRNKSGSL